MSAHSTSKPSGSGTSPPEDKPGTRHRVQFDFTAEGYKRLLRLKERAEAQTNAEVVRDALRLYEWFLARKSEGHKICIVKDDFVKEIEFLF